MTIITQERFSPMEEAAVNLGFAEYNSDQGQESLRKPVALVCYSDDGELIGALDGYVFFDWLTISRL